MSMTTKLTITLQRQQDGGFFCYMKGSSNVEFYDKDKEILAQQVAHEIKRGLREEEVRT